MIYTVTFNPALDYVLHVEEIENGRVNRSEKEDICYGGKGINVSVMLKRLGFDNKCLGFCGGFTGDILETMLKEEGIKTDFIRLDNRNTRINVKLKTKKYETEINAGGPEITETELSNFMKKLEALKNEDILVLAGSIPKSIPEDIYLRILDKINDRNILTVVDAEKNLLINSLDFHPFLIKPNKDELSQIFNMDLKTEEDIIKCAETLQRKGARNVMVSLAGEGAVLLDENGKKHRRKAYKGDVLNSVGAGDSAVAGFIAGYIQEKDYSYALKLSCAAGGATAFSENLGSKEKVSELMLQDY